MGSGIKRRQIAEKHVEETPPKVKAEANPVSNIKKLEAVKLGEATMADERRGNDTSTQVQGIAEPASSSRMLQAVRSVISRTRESRTYPGKYYYYNEATGQSCWL